MALPLVPVFVLMMLAARGCGAVALRCVLPMRHKACTAPAFGHATAIGRCDYSHRVDRVKCQIGAARRIACWRQWIYPHVFLPSQVS